MMVFMEEVVMICVALRAHAQAVMRHVAVLTTRAQASLLVERWFTIITGKVLFDLS